MKSTLKFLAMALVLLCAPAGVAQSYREFASNIIIPQRRVIPIHQPEVVRITEVRAEVRIDNQAAVTELEVHVENPGPRRLEAELVLPVPDGTVVFFFTNLGRLEPAEAKTRNGVASVNFVADSRSGIATISATSTGSASARQRKRGINRWIIVSYLVWKRWSVVPRHRVETLSRRQVISPIDTGAGKRCF